MSGSDRVGLAEDAAVAAHLGGQRLGQRVHDADADPVQAAGDLVALAAELPAGVEHREDDLERALSPLVGHGGDRDAAAVVGDRA
jgi:hypothetical protein